ncbi:dockerin type I domain-containing protein [Enterococcus faecalis]|uniref:dockerin type I domain-containing protein n=1 Tax=Enterococcus faecalis TaxID=1351 RepID=UPI0034CE8B92
MKKILTTLLISAAILGASISATTSEANADEAQNNTAQTTGAESNYVTGESLITPYYKITPSYPKEIEPNTDFAIYYNVEELKQSNLYSVQVLATVENGKFITATPLPTSLTEKRINFLDTDRTKQFKVMVRSGESGQVKISGKLASAADDMQEPELNYSFTMDIKDLALIKAKEAAKQEINALPNLSAEEKADFVQQVEVAKDIPTVNSVVEAAKNKDKENAAAALAKAKETAKQEINALPNLSAEEKADFVQQVEVAKDIPTVNSVVEAAKNKDKENAAAALANAKEAAKQEINALPNLSAEEKADFVQQVEAAKDIPFVNSVVEAAKNKDKENAAVALAKAKETAKREINALPNLSSEEKADFVKQVEAAKDIPTVNRIVEAAKNKDGENALAKGKEAAKQEINALPNLSAEEKADFVKQVAAAKDIPTVNKIVEAAKNKNNSNALDKVKEEAKQEINKLPNLTEKEKADFNKQVDEAKTPKQVDRIVEEAKDKDSSNALDKAKETAKQEINKLPNLTEEEKADFNKQVDEAKTPKQVDRIVEEAKDKDSSNALDKAKEVAKQEINKLPNLTEEEKADFNKKVDEAKTTKQVVKIVEDAKKVNNSYLAGDINNDGKVSLIDLAIMKNYLDQKRLPVGISEKDMLHRGDMNKDNKISLIDLALLKQTLDKQ